MDRTIVTCWGGTYNGFIDIDGLACAVAYAELLRLEGKDALAVMTDPLNASITPGLRGIAKSYTINRESWDEYIIVDMSEPKILETFVPLDKITEIYDHHFWYEEYWKERLGNNSVIEYIGAAATLIWEQYDKRGFADRISIESATLLAHAIISNAANFRSNTTIDRDRKALQELEQIAGLATDWIITYFLEQQDSIRENIAEAIKLDTKICNFRQIHEPSAFGQIEIWDTETFLEDVNLDNVFRLMGYENWIFNLMELDSGKTVIISNMEEILSILSGKLHLPVVEKSISLDTIIFRKEILALLD